MMRRRYSSEVDSVTIALAIALFCVSSLTGVAADATENSLLDCSPLVVEPGQNITCTIYVRDSLQDLTTKFSLTDFYVVPLPTISQTVLTMSPLTLGGDLASVVFTISAATGTNIVVNAYNTQANQAIRGSGLTAAVLVWPATRLGPISCDSANFVGGALPLRSSTTCTASVTGSNNLPAVIRPGDVYLSEDHFAGTFQFVSGAKQLIFSFTASPSIVAPFDAFNFRVTLANSEAVYSVAVPMTYPLVPPAAVSTLQCSGVFRTACYIGAQDAVGPVIFQPSAFTVLFEALDATTSNWISSTGQMNLTMSPAAYKNMEQLTWSLLVNNQISTQRIRVFIAGGNPATSEIHGSPFLFTAGVPPTAASASLRGCADKYIAAGNSTTCVIDLFDGVTGDSRYYLVSSAAGAIISPLVYSASDTSNGGTPVVTFSYTAPATLSKRVEDILSVTVAGTPVLNSPRRVILYVATSVVVENNNSAAAQIPKMIALGLCIYGVSLVIGAVLFFKRQARIRKVGLARAAVEREEMKRVQQGVAEEHHTFATAVASAASAAPSAAATQSGSVGSGRGATPIQGITPFASSLPTRDILGPRSVIDHDRQSSTTGESPKSVRED